jgi:hypothetical protein
MPVPTSRNCVMPCSAAYLGGAVHPHPVRAGGRAEAGERLEQVLGSLPVDREVVLPAQEVVVDASAVRPVELQLLVHPGVDFGILRFSHEQSHPPSGSTLREPS